MTNLSSDSSLEEAPTDPKLQRALEFICDDNEFFLAAEAGDVETLKSILLWKNLNIQQLDHLGRNALHLVVCSRNIEALTLLLQAGINPNVKDNVGMTPLSLCLWRNPSIKIVDLLFNYGAVILPRYNIMDTGLFLQFVLSCVPTLEEEMILRSLVEHGALVNDPDAPGGRSALHLAAMSNNCELIDILISLGADVYATNYRNETPKDFAKIFKCKDAYIHLEGWEESSSSSSSSSHSNKPTTSTSKVDNVDEKPQSLKS